MNSNYFQIQIMKCLLYNIQQTKFHAEVTKLLMHINNIILTNLLN